MLVEGGRWLRRELHPAASFSSCVDCDIGSKPAAMGSSKTPIYSPLVADSSPKWKPRIGHLPLMVAATWGHCCQSLSIVRWLSSFKWWGTCVGMKPGGEDGGPTGSRRGEGLHSYWI